MGALLAERYEILRELGRGGMGEVLLARQVNIGRLVVIKRVLGELASEKHVRMLLEEAQIAARLHHPCIVAVLDVSREVSEAFIAMEYVAGVSLRELLVKAPTGLPKEVALQIAFDVLRGLDYAHGVKSGEFVGVVHRDIKPRNVMVTFAGDTKVIDFGISRWLAGDGAWESTSVSGTHGYMPPEQQQGKRVDARADQYAIGITLREMVSGISPREAEATVQAGKPAAPRGDVDEELEAIIDRATAHDPDNRFASCAALSGALQLYAKQRGVTPSPLAVERWLRENLAERIATWERDAARASEPSMPQLLNATQRTGKPVAIDSTGKPAPADIVGDTAGAVLTSGARTVPDTGKAIVSSGARTMPAGPSDESPTTARSSLGERLTPPPTRKHTVRRRWPAIAAAGVLLVVGGGGAAWWATRTPAATAPPPPALVSVTAINEGSADDAWLAPAIEHLGTQAMRDVPERRFPVARDNDPRPSRHIVLAYRHTPAGLQIEARVVDTASKKSSAMLARGAGPSVADALEQLVPPLVKALGEGQPDPAPDDEERTQMAAVGASSLAQYRRFRALSVETRLAGWIDSDRYATYFDELVKADPTWAHPYGDLFWLRGSGTSPVASKLLADARAKVDGKRDPSGVKLLDSLEAERVANYALMEKLSAPLFEANNEDMLAGEALYAALSNMHRGDDGRAVFRRLHERFPSLYFVADIGTALIEEGREDQAQRVVSDALASHPENLTASREVVRSHARKGELDDAKRVATRALLVHGERPVALAELFEMMVLAGDLSEAQRLVDAMLLGSPLSKARGRYRQAVLAIFEGRLNAATLSARQAIEAYGGAAGEESEVGQALMLLRSVGDPAAARAATTQFAELITSQDDPETATVYRYRAELVPGAKNVCPKIEPYLAKLDEVDRIEARRDITRSAAMAGCAPCKDVLAAGFSDGELSAESLILHGDCAMKERDLPIAKRAYEQATQLWSSWWSSEASPYYAILAHQRLARVAHELGDNATARREYERFLAAWGKPDRPIAEADAARRELAALPAP
ncbi:MAG TPA: protein kinase [Kofleriaceae bacterium]|nr:protein kinase [Kofleriaceae bacterium]